MNAALRRLASIPFLIVPTSLASAQVSTALLRETDPLPGAAAGQLVTVIQSPTANQVGGFAVAVNTSSGGPTTSHVFGSLTGGAGTTLRSAQASLAGYSQASFEFTMGFGDQGEIVYGPTCVDLVSGATGLDTVWIDDTPLGVEGVAIPPLPGKEYGFNSRPNCTGNGLPYWVGGIVDTATGATQGRALFLGTGPTVVLKTGDPAPPPLVSTIGNDGINFDVRFSANGTLWIQVIDTTDPTSADAHLVVNGVIVNDAGSTRISEGQLVSVGAGGNGTELYQNFGQVGINDAGHFFVEGDTNGSGTVDGFLMKTGAMLYREGQSLDGLTLVGSPLSAGVSMNEDGDIAMVWDTTGSVGALFLNGEVLLKEGDSVDWDGDGNVDLGMTVTAFTGIASVVVGPRLATGIDVYFTADVDTGVPIVEGLFRVRVAPDNLTPFCFGDGSQAVACPCANDGAFGHGCDNSAGTGGAELLASGSTNPDSIVLTSSGELSSALSIVLQGNAELTGVGFGDGVRCVGGALKRLYTKNAVAGVVTAPALGDPSITTQSGALGDPIAPGTTRFYQVYYRDPDLGFCPSPPGDAWNVSNGLRITW